MLKKLLGYVPNWKTWVGIVVGVVILRKLEILVPTIQKLTYSDWPVNYFRSGTGA